MSADRPAAVSVVSAALALALALLSVLLCKLLRGLAVLAVLLLPVPLRLFGALHTVAALPRGIARTGGEPEGRCGRRRALALGH